VHPKQQQKKGPPSALAVLRQWTMAKQPSLAKPGIYFLALMIFLA
jgi:hypothetical protein